MKIKLIFLEIGEEKYFGIKLECSDLYFCTSSDKNNKTSHLLKRLTSGVGSWISTENGLTGIITSTRWLEVKSKTEKWLLEKAKEFEFLMRYEIDGSSS